MAGHQGDDKHRLLPGLRRAGRENALPLLAQLLQIARQTLVADDFRHRLFLQAGRRFEHPLLVERHQRHHDAKSQDEGRPQKTEGMTGAQTGKAGDEVELRHLNPD